MLQWKTPALSALVLLGGSFCALAGEFILRGDHTVTPLKGESVPDCAAASRTVGLSCSCFCISC